ncbi:MAG: GNAT family N-acetyltransferase [Clostridia bacterium]|nr:GNAT family N-acetyltransferase [Clostridia bacterium]
MEIKLYEDRYRDDLIFMVLEAKDALGRIPRINDDLLDIKGCYFDRGDLFWIAVDENDRVVGCVGFTTIEGSFEAFVHRLYVKASLKRRGLGSALLETAEGAMRERGVAVSRVHLGEPKEQWFESYSFYPKHGYTEYAPRYMMKRL